MEQVKVISGNSDNEIWQQVASDLNQESLQYNAILKQGEYNIHFDMDIDLGGGFEGGYELTSFSAAVHACNHFRFAVHREDFIDEVGKFFGMEDIIIGYPEFDEKFIIKTNNTERVKAVFSDAHIRETLLSIDDFTLQIAHHKIDGSEEKQCVLELDIETGLTDTLKLEPIYHTFYHILVALDKNSVI